MHVRIWPLMLTLALSAGCAPSPPAEEAPSTAEESAATTEQAPQGGREGALAEESFESGRSETLEPVESPAAAEQGE